jgi:hypothetical protein
MLEWGHLRINNTSVCWNEVTWESITHLYARLRSPENQQYLSMLEWGHHSSILMCYYFSWYLIPAYWCVIDFHGTWFQHTDVLLILMLPHSSILMCYWFSCGLIPIYWSIVDSQNDTLVCWHEVPCESITYYYAFTKSGSLRFSQFSGCWLIWLFIYFWVLTFPLLLPLFINVLLILMWPHSSILLCYWFSCHLIPA